ncbi:MAG: hypothetical protein DIU61_012560 [Bacteroidota bacterium]|jgi:hypothetical protein|nr:MAG: hypothetical protein DIU61_09950 [Bacteroidota bacterium]
MKVAEKDDSKEKLREKSEAYKTAIEHEVKELSDRTERALINVAIVAGAVGVAYLVYRGLTSSSKSKKKSGKARRKEFVAVEDEEPDTQEESRFATILSSVGTVLASQAAAYLLTFARQKLIEYLKEGSEQKENNQPAD